ncbi:MAG TPA: hypothetical protein VKZ44_01790 [Taishania sp.]|nr:hypothetical protein [Taishania sp.]
MQWIGMSTVFFTAMVKFMFSPALGPALNLSYTETFIANLAGAFVATTIFYFGAEFFLKASHKRKIKKLKEAQEKGIELKRKKIFTRKNKLIIKIKNKIGIIPFAFWVPFFLSIPIGSIITAKFFGKHKITYPLILIGIVLNNCITVSIVYLF